MELLGLFTGNLLFYIVEFIALIAVAVAGIFTGKALRSRKDKKTKQRIETENE